MQEKINENHTFIKRKQGEYFLGMLISANIVLGMADILDMFWVWLIYHFFVVFFALDAGA